MDVLISENQLPKNAGVVVVILNNYDEFYQVLDYSFHILKCDNMVNWCKGYTDDCEEYLIEVNKRLE